MQPRLPWLVYRYLTKRFIWHESVVRGQHVYKRVWSTVVGEILQLSCEEDNDHDRFSVSVMKAEFVVGHSPEGCYPALFGTS